MYMQEISRLTAKFIKITNALKHADSPREFALYRSMLTSDELEALNYVHGVVSPSSQPPAVETQPTDEPSTPPPVKSKRGRKKGKVAEEAPLPSEAPAAAPPSARS